MNDTEMVVMVVAIVCSTGIGLAVVNAIKTVLSGRGRRANDSLAAEVRELREEIRQLRQQNNDIILALDGTPDRRISTSGSRVSEIEQPLRRG